MHGVDDLRPEERRDPVPEPGVRDRVSFDRVRSGDGSEFRQDFSGCLRVGLETNPIVSRIGVAMLVMPFEEGLRDAEWEGRTGKVAPVVESEMPAGQTI